MSGSIEKIKTKTQCAVILRQSSHLEGINHQRTSLTVHPTYHKLINFI